MGTSTDCIRPRIVDVYINNRRYCTFTRCRLSIEALQQRLAEYALIRDGRITLVERDDYNLLNPSATDRW